MSLDLKRFSGFRAVVATGSVTAAAARLHKVPSAISYDLRRLEEQLGFAVLAKHGRGLRLTAQGRVLADAINRAYREVERAIDRVSHPDATGEPLRVAAVSGFGRYRLLPKLVGEMPPTRPLDLRFATADDALRLVETGAVGYGISYRPMISRMLQSRRIGEEALVLVSPLASPRCRRGDLPGLRYVTYDEYEYVFQTWLRAHGIEAPPRWRTIDHFGELEEALEAVAAGRGHCVVPEDAALAPAYRGRVRVERFGRTRCTNAIYLFGSPSLMSMPDAALLEQAARP